jgi:hypothetical protein
MIVSSWLIGVFAGAASAVVLYPACLFGSIVLSVGVNRKDHYGEGLMDVGHYAGIIAPIAVALWVGSSDMREANSEMAARLEELTGQTEQTHSTPAVPEALEVDTCQLVDGGHYMRMVCS